MTYQQFEEQTEASVASENKKEFGAGIEGGWLPVQMGSAGLRWKWASFKEQ